MRGIKYVYNFWQQKGATKMYSNLSTYTFWVYIDVLIAGDNVSDRFQLLFVFIASVDFLLRLAHLNRKRNRNGS